MRVVDASVLISALHPPDANYPPSRAWFMRYLATGQPMVVPRFGLVEVAGALCRRSGDRPGTRRALRFLLNLPSVRVVDVDPRLMQRTMFLAATVGLRGADAVYVAVAYQQRAPLVTWDADQRNRAAPLVTAYTPLTDPA